VRSLGRSSLVQAKSDISMTHDTELQHAVQAELGWEPSVVAAHIGVTARAGVVTLTGHVESYAGRGAAENAARRVKGVKGVVEQIEVQLPHDARRSDEDLAAAVIERLAWDVSVPRDAIAVMVQNGRVTLTGQVDWRFQRDAAEQDVRRLYGVTGVSNLVAIRPTVDVSNLRDDIQHALHRSWYFDPNTIAVEAEAGKVRLTGTARSPHEQQVAAMTAWSAPGVTAVENDITLN
jgi:osmotically-inducible protein OsmY